ncbi:MAG: oxygen-independent coproporphyrinogen III oxidase [Clostridia bacterium]|nr:oxygen-independent coproporphyrinogen III oxidase [Clostridia bacterium]
MRKVGIYIHIPFCKQKCFYCDFLSFCDKTESIDKYIECMKKEIKLKSNKKGFIIDTIYIGGGTPSVIDGKLIREVLETIRESFIIDKEAEITIEVNPGTVNKEKLMIYKESGINRISIGLQSTNSNLLKMLGRIHTYEEFMECFKLARHSGFKNINVDLMIGLPNQTLEDINQSIEIISNLNPEHISVYSLIVEEGTKISRDIEKGVLILPKEEFERKMYWTVKEKLANNGYIHYEISNFAKEGYESKHNMNCWNQKEYLGFGASAHSYINHIRYSNIESLDKYIDNISRWQIEKNKEVHEIQDIDSSKKEYMLLGLRKIDGVNITEFKNKFADNPIYLFRKELSKLAKEDLIEIDENSIKLTNKGLDLANLVWEEFV